MLHGWPFLRKATGVLPCLTVGEVKSPLEGLRDWSPSALEADPLGFPSRTGSPIEGRSLGVGSEWRKINQDHQGQEENPDKSGRRRLSQKHQDTSHHVFVHHVKRREGAHEVRNADLNIFRFRKRNFT